MSSDVRIIKRVKLLNAAFFMIVAITASAGRQDTRPYELDHANKKLNSIYRIILGKMKFSDQMKLKKAQREWIIFRDLDCTWAYSAEPLDCMIDRTKNRTKELEETTFSDVKGEYISIENEDGIRK